jgi:hypothetical protein
MLTVPQVNWDLFVWQFLYCWLNLLFLETYSNTTSMVQHVKNAYNILKGIRGGGRGHAPPPLISITKNIRCSWSTLW